CPLQHPRPSPPVDAGIRLPCSGPWDGWAPELAANLKFLKMIITLLLLLYTVKHCCFNAFHILSLLLCPAPCLHFYCSFCLETEKRPWRPKSVPLCQKRFLDRLENSDSKSEPLAELSDNDSCGKFLIRH
ncbi:unnamed protein product, partial [Staurois parvus]